MVNPCADLKQAFLNFTSTFFVDNRAHLFSQALLVTLKSSFTWSEEECSFMQYACEDFLEAIPLPLTSPLPTSPTYILSVNVPDDKADFFAEVLLCFPQMCQIQFLLHYLLCFYQDLPGYPVPDHQVVTDIFT